MFDKQQQREFLGDRFDKLRRLEADAMAIPRSLETVLEIPDSDLEGIRTLGDLY